MLKISYKFYATLLDSFQYYLSKVDDDNAYQDFIDKLNRKPFTSKAAFKGSAFNEYIDKLITGQINELDFDKKGNHVYTYTENEVSETFSFKAKVVNEISAKVKGSIIQDFISAPLKTRFGIVELYGYSDYVWANKVTDLKTTGRYTFPKFLAGWQRKIYPYCYNHNGVKVDTFEYLVTDFSNVYSEEYVYNPEKDIPVLRAFVEHLIDFIESNRPKITSQDPKVLKLFGA